MFTKILIANRGEIACRIIRTCKRMGICTVAVYSEADQFSQHVIQADEAYMIGGPRPVDSYLKGDVIIEMARKSGAQAIHPGYGFLSENEQFAANCEKAGLAFIGPTPQAIEKMGSKSAAKALMEAAGVPVVPGYHGDNQDAAFLAAQSQIVGYPQLIKAVAGGGGKGMRLVEKFEDFSAQLAAAMRESKNAFGDDAVLIERYVQSPHHIEFQVFGDTHGNYVHLFERECSIQRRHQKVLEETPSPFIESADDDMRDRMGAAAVAAARAIAYRGAGTIEFIVGGDRQFFFMEMNTRLQVEHPITEMITGEDLVEWQLRVAAGEPLPLTQNEILSGGHAIEVRICAEDPANDFLPETGRMHLFAIPQDDEDGDVRLDTGVVTGDTISVYYDPMIAKLITWGADRAEAIRRMQAALGETDVLGVKTNLEFLEQLVQHPAFIDGDTDTGFIPRHREALMAKPALDDLTLAAACARVMEDEAPLVGSDPWSQNSGWRMNGFASRLMEFKVEGLDEPVECHVDVDIGVRYFRHGETRLAFSWLQRDDGTLKVKLGESKNATRVLRAGDQLTVITPRGRTSLTLFDPFYFEQEDTGAAGRLTAMMPGRVVKVMANAGDHVKKGQPLIILEAMKMEHTIVSPKDGVVDRVAFKENDLVPADAVLFAFIE
ncbi:MAG: acetyl/propionyl/methylcrotonyl-CoA carboxylase subunit alpha [Betaproteobacteria bacterium]|nr:acetyl/propionyl/methylcrotonyl-CoA carboxylase subunit alpha [Betaproteobacteria bacterium]